MSNITEIENIIDKLSMIGTTKSSIFSSIAWTSAFSLTSRLVFLNDIVNYKGNVSEKQENAIKNCELQIAELSNVLTWAIHQANKNYLPTSEEVVNRFCIAQEPRQIDIKTFAELQNISLEEAEKLLLSTAKNKADKIKREKQVLLNSLERYLTVLIYDESFEIKEATALSIANKLVQKTEQYSQNKLIFAVKQLGSLKIQSEIAADRKLLNEANEMAEKLVLKLERGLNNIQGEVKENGIH